MARRKLGVGDLVKVTRLRAADEGLGLDQHVGKSGLVVAPGTDIPGVPGVRVLFFDGTSTDYTYFYRDEVRFVKAASKED